MPIIETYRHFAELPAETASLFQHACQARGFFVSRPWFENLVDAGMEMDTPVRIYAAREEAGRDIALLLPLRESHGRFGLRKLEGLANWYSSLYAVIAAPDREPRRTLHLLAQAIASESPRWDVLDFHPLDPRDPLFEPLLQALRGAGMAIQRYFCFANWYLEVAGRSYEAYAATLPSRLKSTLRRKGRQLEKSGRARFDIVCGGEQLEQAIAAYQAVYSHSWKSAEPAPAFLPGLIRTCASQGWLRLGIATVDGQPVAAQLWIVCNGVASIYKLAYDERYASLSIGSLLTERLMRHVIDIDHVAEVDYLTGDDAYKRDWMSHRRERCGIVAFNLRSVRGLAAAALNFSGVAVKSGLRRLRPARLAPG